MFINNIELSGLTKKEAKEKINKALDENKELNLKFNNQNYKIDINKLGTDYKVDELVQKAYLIGRDDSLLKDIKTKMKLKLGEKYVINLKASYDEKKINSYINFLEKDINVSPKNSIITVINGKLNIEQEIYGIKINTNELKKVIIYKIENLYLDDTDIPVIKIKPKYIYKDLCKIDTILGTYETCFNENNANRVNNIEVAANATNNTLLGFDEEFSFNDATHDKDTIAKFKKAPVIINGKLEEGLGGGICQVSSTIYNAALYAGLEIINVNNHTIPSGYIPKGRDATVTMGLIDLKFRNKFQTPILISNKIYDNKIVSTIYGSKEYKKDIEVITEIKSTLPNKVKMTNDDKLYKGEKSIEQRGQVGYKVYTFRVYKEKDGLTKEFIHESYYPPIDKIIRYGTKAKPSHYNIDCEII